MRAASCSHCYLRHSVVFLILINGTEVGVHVRCGLAEGVVGGAVNRVTNQLHTEGRTWSGRDGQRKKRTVSVS